MSLPVMRLAQNWRELSDSGNLHGRRTRVTRQNGSAAAHTSALAPGDSAIASCEASAQGLRKSLWVGPAPPSA